MLVKTMLLAGVEPLFSLPGNHISCVYDALSGSATNLLHIRHEVVAVHMADNCAGLKG